MAGPLALDVLTGRLAICRLGPGDPEPRWARGAVVSVTRTPDELSVVCAEEAVPAGVPAELGWRVLRAAGPLDFAEVGHLAAIADCLAAAGVSIFAVSTYDTDYVLVKEAMLGAAVAALREAGHPVSGATDG